MLLRGGLVADGIGAATVRADVLIDGPVIASIGARDAPAGGEVIDLAPGSVVCPGFIDAHAHAEGPLLATGRVDGALAQGVTTLVAGQDGQSWIGASAATARYLNRYFAPVNGALEPARGLSLAAYREAVTGRLTQNVAVLASQGTIRHNVAGLTRGPLDRAELAAARREVENALADGAVGLSSGLDYLPSRFGAAGEIADIARPLAGAERPYVSRMCMARHHRCSVTRITRLRAVMRYVIWHPWPTVTPRGHRDGYHGGITPGAGCAIPPLWQ